MAKNITQYDLLISCPGDILSEVQIIDEVGQQFNDQYSDVLGIGIRTKHWKKHSYPQSGGKPQDLLNDQIVKNCDAAVALFWTRFGSPTDDYSSGTEEEIEIMLSSSKQVFMYFSDKPIAPSVMDSEGYKQVCAFRKNYAGKGLYSNYSSDDEFRKQFFAHLSQYFLSKQKIDAQCNGPELVIRSIHERKLVDVAKVVGFSFGDIRSADQFIEDIRKQFEDISSIHITVQEPLFAKNTLFGNVQSLSESLYKPAVVDEKKISSIKAMAEKLSISLLDDFFDLGDLKESAFYFGSGRDFAGSKSAKTKYWKINELHQLIHDASGWNPFLRIFSSTPCLYLALSNIGKSFDEDIEVTLTLPTQSYKHHASFKLPNVFSMEFVTNKIYSLNLFAIESSAEIKNYISCVQSETRDSVEPGLRTIVERDYEKDYRAALDDVFDYDCYWEDDHVKIKLHFDYVKQHTTIAFPTPIFVTDDIQDIQYTIISRNSPEIIQGILKIEK